jgi:hypothetical protein
MSTPSKDPGPLDPDLSLIGDDFVRDVIDDHLAFEVCHGRWHAVLFTNIVFPFPRVETLGLLPRLPQVDAAGLAAIFGQQVVLA